MLSQFAEEKKKKSVRQFSKMRCGVPRGCFGNNLRSRPCDFLNSWLTSGVSLVPPEISFKLSIRVTPVAYVAPAANLCLPVTDSSLERRRMLETYHFPHIPICGTEFPGVEQEAGAVLLVAFPGRPLPNGAPLVWAQHLVDGGTVLVSQRGRGCVAVLLGISVTLNHFFLGKRTVTPHASRPHHSTKDISQEPLRWCSRHSQGIWFAVVGGPWLWCSWDMFVLLFGQLLFCHSQRVVHAKVVDNNRHRHGNGQHTSQGTQGAHQHPWPRLRVHISIAQRGHGHNGPPKPNGNVLEGGVGAGSWVVWVCANPLSVVDHRGEDEDTEG